MAASGPAPPSVSSDLEESPYDRVEVLMLRWSTIEEEMETDDITLQLAFEEYGYGVTVLYADGLGQPRGRKKPGSRVADIVIKWMRTLNRQDGKKTLLVVTYVGHGGRRAYAPSGGDILVAAK